MSIFNLRVNVPENETASGRLIKAYRKGIYGKTNFILDILSVGMILKELGLIDLIKMADEDPTYNALSTEGKRDYIRKLIPDLNASYPNDLPPVILEMEEVEAVEVETVETINDEPKKPSIAKPPKGLKAVKMTRR